jgi:hypothetical protein
MTTQLRLVDPPPAAARTKTSAARSATARTTGARTVRARIATSGRPGTTSNRRAARWGDWHLDDRTRRIGREGIAAAREALERAAALDALRHAS